MKANYGALCEEAERDAVKLAAEIEDNIACKGEHHSWIEHFRQYHNFTELTRKMLVSVVDSIVVYPKSRLEISFWYSYDYMRAVSFTEAVSELHTVPEAKLLQGVM